MLRGMYFMNWYAGDWNYHPLLPPKRMQNVEEIAASGCNLLYWCSMGSGMIGPQILEEELFGQPANRTRFYGFLNDSEFTAECKKRGINTLGVVWRSQLWEFPAEFDEEETRILSFNKLRGVGKKGWIGIRELSTDRYPKIFPSIRNYFPDGLKNSRGEEVKDFLEEFTVKTLDGNKICSMWLHVPGHEHRCYTPCSSNPAFREYLHYEIRQMVKAGTAGVFLDECSTAHHALCNSGCFCPDCMRGFRGYLKKKGVSLPEGQDPETFDYGDYLRGLGYHDEDLNSAQKELRLEIPLFREFICFMNDQDDILTEDLIEYAHACGKEAGREIIVAGNLYDFQPKYAGVRKNLDFLGGEMNVDLRNDEFYQLARAFADGRKGFFTQDYSPHVLDIIDDIKHGKNDTYTLMLFEALAFGSMISVPYGSWLLNYAKEAFWPDLKWDRKLGDWQQSHEKLFSGRQVGSLAVVYDRRAAFEVSEFQSGYTDDPKVAGFRLFNQILRYLCQEGILFRVLYADEVNPLTEERLQGFGTILIPDGTMLPKADQDALKAAAGRGARVAAIGKVAPGMMDYVYRYRKVFEFTGWAKEEPSLLAPVKTPKDYSITVDEIEEGYVLHLVNYRLNTITRRIEDLPPVAFRLSFTPSAVEVNTLPEKDDTAACVQDNILTVRHAGIYTAILLRK